MLVDFEEYQAGKFAGTANTELGRELWSFLSAEKTLDAMEVASDLGQPAIAGIEEALLKKFEDAVLPDRVKQMIGHMVRQIMEREGFVVDQSDVKIRSVPFSKGTRYRRPEWYPVHVFRRSGDAKDLCFADTRTGENLPDLETDDRWLYWTSFSTSLRGVIAFGISPQEVREQVKAQGYVRKRLERMLRPVN